jgi:hypothetical protein
MRFPFFKALGGSIAAIVGIMTAFWIGYQMGFSKAEKYQNTNENSLCTNKSEVLLHSTKGTTDQRAILIMNLLNGKGCRVSEIRAVDTSILDLRYFHKPDSHGAILISNYLRKETGLEIPVKYIPRYAFEVAPGTFEIWLE